MVAVLSPEVAVLYLLRLKTAAYWMRCFCCVRRSGAIPPSAFIPEHNGPVNEVRDPVPNLYKTALELNSSDFYSTYNVDPEQYSKVIQSQPLKRKTVYDSTDNLSASHEDLLASYRGVGEDNASHAGMGQYQPARGFPPELANGTTSPEAHGLRYDNSSSYKCCFCYQAQKVHSPNLLE